MGIETILIVLGAAVVLAIAVGALRARRGVGGGQAPKTSTRSTVRRKR